MGGDSDREVPATDRAPGARRAWAEIAAVFALATAIAAPTVVRDLRRPFDTDEFFTYYASRASGPGELWRVLSGGGFDASPPLYVVAVWQARRLVGDGHLACRLPATIGFVVLCLCLYGFARRRCPPAFAAIAMLIPALSTGVFQASNARPYGLMLGLVGVALVCWQAAAEGRRRRLALAGLAASLALGVASHIYMILLLAPLGMAELARTLGPRRGRIDAPVWIAFACAFAPLPPLWPLLAHASGLARGAAWLAIRHDAVVWTYAENLVRFLPVLLALGAIVLLRGSIRRVAAAPAAGPAYPTSEAVLILGLVALPVVAFALGVFVTKAYVSRYVVAYVAGAGLMLAYGACALFRGSRACGLALLAVTFLCFLITARHDLRMPDGIRAPEGVALAASRAEAAGRRLAIVSWDEYVFDHFYSPPSVRDRLVLLEFGPHRHGQMFRALDRWLRHKGLPAFTIEEGEDFFEDADDYYVSGSVESVIAAAGGRPLSFGLADTPPGGGQRLYAVKRTAAGPP